MGFLANRRLRRMRAEVDAMNAGAEALADWTVAIGDQIGSVHALQSDALDERERLAVGTYASIAFITKMAFNVGPAAGEWLVRAAGDHLGDPMDDVTLIDHVDEPAARYHAAVMRHPGNVPYLQTPAVGTDEALAAHAGEAVALLGHYLCQSGADWNVAVRSGAATLAQYLADGLYDPGAPDHQVVLPWAVMGDLIDGGLVEAVLGFDEASEALS